MPLLLGSTALNAVMLGETPVTRIMHGTVQVYSAGVSITLINSTEVDLSALFDPGDWANADLAKVVNIPDGVTVGSNDNTAPAIYEGAGRAGTLTINVAGTVDGAGGDPNSGVGGDAIELVTPAGVTINNTGNIRSGGGGGGLGGTGGSGSTTTSNDSGWIDAPTIDGYGTQGGTGIVDWGAYGGAPRITWGGTLITYSMGAATTFVSGIYTYHKGAYSGTIYYGGANYAKYQVKRTWNSTTPTSGGAPGAGGRGEGYDQTLLAGSPGASGGTNAGDGGDGGSGGTKGTAGDNGVAGDAGNVGSGASGVAGGLAGFAIANIGTATVNDTGSILGR